MQLNNTPESFYREIRSVEIYAAAALDFKSNMNGLFPDFNNLMYAINVIPEDYDRKIPTKKASGNSYFEVDLNFPLLNLTPAYRADLYKKFNKTGFCVVLNSNTEKMALGNDREPLTIDFLDGIKDNNGGADQFNISVTGATVVVPKSLIL